MRGICVGELDLLHTVNDCGTIRYLDCGAVAVVEVHTEKHIRRINQIYRYGRGFGAIRQRFLASLYQVVEFVSVAPVLEHNPARTPIIRVTLNEFECASVAFTLTGYQHFRDFWSFPFQ